MIERMEGGVEASGMNLVKLGDREAWKEQLFKELERPNISGDVMMVAGGSRVNCHSAILAASSPLLKELLMEQNGEGEIVLDLPDWGRRELELAVKLLYTGEVLLKPDERKIGERVKSLMSTLCIQGVEVGQISCVRCKVVQPNLGAYLNHLDSEHVAQTMESIQDLRRELEDPGGDPEFEDWTCMGCFATDLLPVKKCEVVDSQAAVFSLENHLTRCTRAVEREKERVKRMEEKEDKPAWASIASILNNNLWSVCPLCGDSKKSRDEMVSHLFYHPQMTEILYKSLPSGPTYTCEDGCMTVWAGRCQFMLHKFRNCEIGAKRRLDLLLSKLTKADVLGEEQSDDGFSDISENEAMEEFELEGDTEEGRGQATIGSKTECPSSGSRELKQGLPHISTVATPKSSDASSQTSGNSGDFHIGKEEDKNVKCEDALASTEKGLQTTDQKCLVVDQSCQTASKTDETKQNSNVHKTTQTVVHETVNKSCQTHVDATTEPTPISMDRNSETEMDRNSEMENATHAPDHTTEEESSDIGNKVKRTQNQTKELVGESSIKCSQCHGIFDTSSKYKSKIKHFCKFLGGKLERCPQVEVGAKSGAKRITMTCSLCRLDQHSWTI